MIRHVQLYYDIILALLYCMFFFMYYVILIMFHYILFFNIMPNYVRFLFYIWKCEIILILNYIYIFENMKPRSTHNVNARFAESLRDVHLSQAAVLKGSTRHGLKLRQPCYKMQIHCAHVNAYVCTVFKSLPWMQGKNYTFWAKLTSRNSNAAIQTELLNK